MQHRAPVFPLSLWLLALATLCLGGCAGLAPVKPVDRFEADVDALIERLPAGPRPAVLAPAAIVCGSLREGRPPSRLEEVVGERLRLRLGQQRELYRLTRQNWLELREGRPLTFTGESLDRRRLLRNLVIYEVRASHEPILHQLTLRIAAGDADGRPLPGQMAQTRLIVEEGHPARPLLAAPAVHNPLPEGLEERPYGSLDRLAFSLAAELADAYRAGIRAEGQAVADSDVSVFLCGTRDDPRSRALQSALQQAIVRQRGFSCAAGREDLAPVFRQLDAYQAERRRFALDEERFVPGSVLLLLEATDHADADKVGVALRALWRVAPLESADGALIPTSVAGTYLSGFAAKAYLERAALGDQDRASAPVVGPPPAAFAPSVDAPYTPANQHGFD